MNPLPSALLLALLVRSVSSHLSQNAYLVRVNFLGESAVLNCTEEGVLPDGASVEYWLEPDAVDILYPRQIKKGIEVSPNGLNVTIPEVNSSHLGDYFCLMRSSAGHGNHPFYSRTTLYLYDPAFLDVYRSNLIIGLTAAGLFLVVSTASCCVYVLKFEPREDDDDDTATLSLHENGGYLSSSLQDLDNKKSYQLDTQF